MPTEAHISREAFITQRNRSALKVSEASVMINHLRSADGR